MNAATAFAERASNRLPATMRNRDVISIITMLLPVIIPLIERCFQEREPAAGQTFGAGCQELATETRGNPFKQMRFRAVVRRELGWRDYRDLGGHALCDCLIEEAATSDADTLQSIRSECLSC